LEKESKARIKYKKYCSYCGKEVTSSDIVKGYEYEKNKYVVMTDDELEKIKTKKDKTIHMNYECGGFCLPVIVKHVIINLSVAGRSRHEVRKTIFENITAYY